MQGLNCLKYLSTVVALVMRTMYDLSRQNPGTRTLWRIMAASTSGITTIYNTYWDIVIDWGLLRKNAKNRWLRDKLLISNKAVYAVAIVSISIVAFLFSSYCFFQKNAFAQILVVVAAFIVSILT